MGPAAAATLLAAAAASATLRTLSLRACPAIRGEPEAALGAALAALASSLHQLDLSHCELSDAVIAPLLVATALPNCTLRRLKLAGCSMTKAFQRGALAVAAHCTVPALTELLLSDGDRGFNGKWRRPTAAAVDAQSAVRRRAVGAAEYRDELARLLEL